MRDDRYRLINDRDTWQKQIDDRYVAYDRSKVGDKEKPDDEDTYIGRQIDEWLSECSGGQQMDGQLDSQIQDRQ